MQKYSKHNSSQNFKEYLSYWCNLPFQTSINFGKPLWKLLPWNSYQIKNSKRNLALNKDSKQEDYLQENNDIWLFKEKLKFQSNFSRLVIPSYFEINSLLSMNHLYHQKLVLIKINILLLEKLNFVQIILPHQAPFCITLNVLLQQTVS